jgi:hypothetical protein
MAMRRCRCGVWFQYDARVKDDAVECPECGRILPRSARESWGAPRLARSLVGVSIPAAVVLVLLAVLQALVLVEDGATGPAVILILGGVLVAGVLLLLGLTVRALSDAVGRLEDRVP